VDVVQVLIHQVVAKVQHFSLPDHHVLIHHAGLAMPLAGAPEAQKPLGIEPPVQNVLALEDDATRHLEPDDRIIQSGKKRLELGLELWSQVFVGIHAHGPGSYNFCMFNSPIELSRLRARPGVLNHLGAKGAGDLAGVVGREAVHDHDTGAHGLEGLNAAAKVLGFVVSEEDGGDHVRHFILIVY